MIIAVVCAGPCDGSFIREFFKNRKPDYCIAADRGLLTCLDAGIVPDCILGDYDSLLPALDRHDDTSFRSFDSECAPDLSERKRDDLTRAADEVSIFLEKFRTEGRRILTYPARKDFSDSEAGIREAVKVIGNAGTDSGQEHAVYLLGATGGRLDHFLANLSVLMIPTRLGIRAFIADRQNEITLLTEGCTLKKRDTFGKYVSLIPFTDEVTGVFLDGFKYPLENGTLTHDNTLGLSNEILDESAEIQFDKGILTMILSRD